jgi:hypothetical protein
MEIENEVYPYRRRHHTDTASSVFASPKRLDRSKLRKAMVVETDASGVYVNGRLIGRDPDPAIRESLTNEHYRLSGVRPPGHSRRSNQH